MTTTNDFISALKDSLVIDFAPFLDAYSVAHQTGAGQIKISQTPFESATNTVVFKFHGNELAHLSSSSQLSEQELGLLRMAALPILIHAAERFALTRLTDIQSVRFHDVAECINYLIKCVLPVVNIGIFRILDAASLQEQAWPEPASPQARLMTLHQSDRTESYDGSKLNIGVFHADEILGRIEIDRHPDSPPLTGAATNSLRSLALLLGAILNSRRESRETTLITDLDTGDPTRTAADGPYARLHSTLRTCTEFLEFEAGIIQIVAPAPKNITIAPQNLAKTCARYTKSGRMDIPLYMPLLSTKAPPASSTTIIDAETHSIEETLKVFLHQNYREGHPQKYMSFLQGFTSRIIFPITVQGRIKGAAVFYSKNVPPKDLVAKVSVVQRLTRRLESELNAFDMLQAYIGSRIKLDSRPEYPDMSKEGTHAIALARYNSMAQAALKVTDALRATVFEHSSDTNLLVRRAAVGAWPATFLNQSEFTLPLDHKSALATAIKQQGSDAVFVEDACGQGSDYYPIEDASRDTVCACAAIPIFVSRTKRAALYVDWDNPAKANEITVASLYRLVQEHSDAITMDAILSARDGTVRHALRTIADATGSSTLACYVYDYPNILTLKHTHPANTTHAEWPTQISPTRQLEEGEKAYSFASGDTTIDEQKQRNVHFELNPPISKKIPVRGLILLKDSKPITGPEQILLGQLADAVSEDLRQANETYIANLEQQLAPLRSTQQVTTCVFDWICQIFGRDCSAMVRIREENDLVLAASHCNPYGRPQLRVSPNFSFAAQCFPITKGEPFVLYVRDVTVDAIRRSPSPHPDLLIQEVRSLVIVKFEARDLSGFFYVLSPNAAVFTPAHLSLISCCADILGRHLEDACDRAQNELVKRLDVANTDYYESIVRPGIIEDDVIDRLLRNLVNALTQLVPNSHAVVRVKDSGQQAFAVLQTSEGFPWSVSSVPLIETKEISDFFGKLTVKHFYFDGTDPVAERVLALWPPQQQSALRTGSVILVLLKVERRHFVISIFLPQDSYIAASTIARIKERIQLIQRFLEWDVDRRHRDSTRALHRIGLYAYEIAHSPKQDMDETRAAIENLKEDIQIIASSGRWNLDEPVLQSMLKWLQTADDGIKSYNEYMMKFKSMLEDAKRPAQKVVLRAAFAQAVDKLSDQMSSETVAEFDIINFEETHAIEGDFVTIVNIFTQLIRNSRESVPSTREVPLKIRIKSEVRSDGEVVVTIEDNGPGLPAGFPANLDSSDFTTKGLGHGSGLFSANRSARDHGGTLEPDLRFINGARFILTFPEGVSE
jgi:signal transduction histidine kinase